MLQDILQKTFVPIACVGANPNDSDCGTINVKGKGELDFRIGINSGPVVAGVIGRKKFIY